VNEFTSCLQRTAHQTKEAGALLYLMEELGDARLRCDQLVRYIADTTVLINKSSHKDHIFETAGHLVNSIPETAFKLQKALEATALAADRLDYEEIKQGLLPEKVEELERVLKDVRIRYVQRRSEDRQMQENRVSMKPKQAADELREIAKLARESGALALDRVASLVESLDPEGVITTPTVVASTMPDIGQVADQLEHLASSLEDRSSRPSPRELATVLSHTVPDAVVNKLAAVDDAQIAIAFETMRKSLVVAMRQANAKRYRLSLTNLLEVVDGIATVLVHLGSIDTQKSEAFKREIMRTRLGLGGFLKNELSLDPSVLASSDDDAKRSRFEEGKPADPTENMSEADAKKWKIEHEKNKDNFTKEAGDPTENMSEEDKKKWEANQFKKKEAGDPTENMSEEDKKKWEANQFKKKEAALAWKV
jgi:hypothetical protein